MVQSPSIRPLRRFAQVDNRGRALVVEAVVCLLLARLGLIFVPFPKLARRLGDFVAPGDPRVSAARARLAARRGAGRRDWLGGDALGALRAVQGGACRRRWPRA